MSDTSGLISQFYVKLSGADASEDFMRDLQEITVETSLHLPDVATIILHDPRLKWIDERSLEPGTPIEISARTRGEEQPFFDGEVVELEPEFGPSNHRLIVRAFDRLHRLSRGRQVRTFVNVTDGDLVNAIAPEVGLQAQVGATSQVHDYVIQSNQTNLEFLRQRAAGLGYLVFVRGKTLHFDALRSNGQPVKLEWGASLTEFHPRLTTVDQVTGVTVRGWDPKSRQEIVGQAQNGNGAPQVGESRSGGQFAEQAFNVSAKDQVASRPVRNQVMADQIAQATADRAAGRYIEADGTCAGNPGIVAGAMIEIDAVGNRFSGSYFVTSAIHTYRAEQGYSTQFTVSGHRPATLLSLLMPEPTHAPELSLVIGVVTDNQDPEGQGRVKVKFPWLSADHTSDWARMVVPGGGAERGIEFLPEVNDEVLVGFEMGDIHHPYVLGGLWNGQDAPPKSSSELVSSGKVQQRLIRSRSGHLVILDDADGGGGITIEDRNGNKIAFETQSNKLKIEFQGDVEVTCSGNYKVQAQGQVSISGSSGITVESGAAVDIKGMMINLN